MQQERNQIVVIKKACHSRKFLSGIFHVLICYVHKAKTLYINNQYVEDPRLQTSGMTPNLAGFTIRPTSPRKVVIRGLIKLTQYLQRRPLPVLNDMRGRSRIKYGMTSYFKGEPLNKNALRALLRSGFTLIELLVVVLIISILAAVAVPQYKRAVKKSYFVSAFPALKSTVHAQELFALENGKYATSEPLLITTPIPKEVSIYNNFSNIGDVRIIYCPGKTANEVCDLYATKQVVIADIYLSKRDLLRSDISGRAGQKHCSSRNKHGYLCDAFCEAFGPCSMVNRN